MSHHVQALRQVIEADLQRLNELETRLKEVRGPVVAGVVKSIGEACDSLSAALSRLAKNTDTIATDHESSRPEPDPRVLEIGKRTISLVRNGLCADCGGVIQTNEQADTPSATPWRVNRTRASAE